MAKRRSSMAEGSKSNQRAEAACARALDAYMQIGRAAAKVSDELDDLTSPGRGIPTTELSDEDSAVIVVGNALAAHKG